MASPNPIDPNVEEELRLRFGMPVRTVLCSPANINDVIAKHVPRDGSGPVPAAKASPPNRLREPAPARPMRRPRLRPKGCPAGPLTDEDKKQRRDAHLHLRRADLHRLHGLVLPVPGLSGLAQDRAGHDPRRAVVAGIVWKVKSR